MKSFNEGNHSVVKMVFTIDHFCVQYSLSLPQTCCICWGRDLPRTDAWRTFSRTFKFDFAVFTVILLLLITLETSTFITFSF